VIVKISAMISRRLQSPSKILSVLVARWKHVLRNVRETCTNSLSVQVTAKTTATAKMEGVLRRSLRQSLDRLLRLSLRLRRLPRLRQRDVLVNQWKHVSSNARENSLILLSVQATAKISAMISRLLQSRLKMQSALVAH
jgi:hypothetical protein